MQKYKKNKWYFNEGNTLFASTSCLRISINIKKINRQYIGIYKVSSVSTTSTLRRWKPVAIPSRKYFKNLEKRK